FFSSERHAALSWISSPECHENFCMALCGEYQASMVAAAFDAQLTALSTGTCLIEKRPEKQGFPHELMLRRSESGRRCRVRLSRRSRTCPRLTIVWAWRWKWRHGMPKRELRRRMGTTPDARKALCMSSRGSLCNQ